MRFEVKKLKGVLASLAPTVGRSLGGPLAGMGIKLLADRLGVSNTTDPVKLEEYIEKHPEAIPQLQEADNEFRRTLEERQIDLETFKTQVEDVQHSRLMFGDDPTPKAFAIIALLGFLGYIFMVTFNVPESDVLPNVILGYLGGLISGISSFFYGSSNNNKS